MDAVAERIEEEQPQMIAISMLTNATGEVREALQHEKLQKILKASYEMKGVGRYYVWTRREVEAVLPHGR